MRVSLREGCSVSHANQFSLEGPSASECGEERASVKGDVRQMGVGEGLRGGGGEEAVHEMGEVGWLEGWRGGSVVGSWGRQDGRREWG